MSVIDKLAEKLYENYCREVGGKAFNGDPLPNWKDFSSDPNKQKQSNAWVSVAVGAVGVMYDASQEELTELFTEYEEQLGKK